jgi:hypothetical protein
MMMNNKTFDLKMINTIELDGTDILGELTILYEGTGKRTSKMIKDNCTAMKFSDNSMFMYIDPSADLKLNLNGKTISTKKLMKENDNRVSTAIMMKSITKERGSIKIYDNEHLTIWYETNKNREVLQDNSLIVLYFHAYDLDTTHRTVSKN